MLLEAAPPTLARLPADSILEARLEAKRATLVNSMAPKRTSSKPAKSGAWMGDRDTRTGDMPTALKNLKGLQRVEAALSLQRMRAWKGPGATE